MSHAAKGLSPLAGGLGVPEAWYTAVVVYGPAEAGTAMGATTSTAAAAKTSRGMLLLTAHLRRSTEHEWPHLRHVSLVGSNAGWPRLLQTAPGYASTAGSKWGGRADRCWLAGQ